LDLNPFQPNLLASGASDSEIYVWDLNSPDNPLTPGAKSLPPDNISCLSWNRQVQHILASTSPCGRCVVWDLRKNEPIIKVSDQGSMVCCMDSNYVLQLISRNFGRASCKVGWEFVNYKHEIMLIGNRPIKFGSFEIQMIEIRNEILMKFVMKTYCIKRIHLIINNIIIIIISVFKIIISLIQ
jgi:hypothetical protein